MDFEQRRPQLRVLGLCLAAEARLRQRHAHLLRDCAYRLGEGNILNLLDEAEHIALLATAKAIKILASGMYAERWCLLFVKGAQTGIVLRARFLQADIIADHADDVRLLLQRLREIGGHCHGFVQGTSSDVPNRVPL